MRSKKQPDDQKRTFVDEARRAQLIRCTIEAIDELGFHKASLAEIAKSAGITKGAIFYHFANRDELIDSVAAEVAGAGMAYILPKVQAAETPRAQLRAYVEAFVSALDVDPAAIRVLYAIGQSSYDAEGHSKYIDDRELQETAIAPLEEILRRGQESGELGEFDIRSMALMIRSTLEALPHTARGYPDLDLTAYGQNLITFFERGCGVP